MNLLERAIQIALEAHAGQKDKNGRDPYVLHPLRVMGRMKTEESRIVAALHDVVEDSPWTLEMLRAEGFSEAIVHAVDCLTKREGEDYEQFVKRAAGDPIARVVKLGDLADNKDINRLDELTAKDLDRLNKYKRAENILGQKA